MYIGPTDLFRKVRRELGRFDRGGCFIFEPLDISLAPLVEYDAPHRILIRVGSSET